MWNRRIDEKMREVGFVISVFYSNREVFLHCLKCLFFDYGEGCNVNRDNAGS